MAKISLSVIGSKDYLLYLEIKYNNQNNLHLTNTETLHQINNWVKLYLILKNLELELNQIIHFQQAVD